MGSRSAEIFHPLAHTEDVLWQLEPAAVFKDWNQFVELGSGV